jgi:hypothetical protein
MTYNEFLQNFLPEFSKIKSYKGRIEYANQYLTKLGSGSGRVVYDIDGTKVFKVAKNTKGVAQNEVESSIGRDYYTQDLVTEVFESADDDSWIIAEKAKKVSEKRIIQLTGIPNLSELYYYLRNNELRNKGSRGIHHQDDDIVEQLNENEFAANILDFIINYNQSAGDLGRYSSYGEVVRNGQSQIVITDYGLNDEVYQTHYTRKDKQPYRMYELFNHADGNDDDLSYVDDGDIIRHGMWALIPYGVGDGTDTINEDFINFVSNRDNYPSRPLTVMPYLMEVFHECVNNLEEVLNKVEDKKKFYINLLKLQEYLIEQKFYDREPLKLYEGEMMDEKYDVNTAEAIAKKIAEKYGFKKLEYIGGGNFGVAYDVGENKVLKITSDRTEANENLKLKGKPLQYIAEPYEVIRISPKTTQIPETYAIILEKLQTDVNEFRRLIDRMEFAFKRIMGVDYYDVILHYTDQEDFSVDEDKVNAYMKRNPQDAEFFYGIIRIAEELKKYGIESVDYINPSNLGYKQNGALAFFDVGFGSESPSSEKPRNFEIDEDGSAKFSQVDSIGRDDFPTYDQNDTSPLTDNNIPTTTDEDLEYRHADDATQDEYIIDEDMEFVGGSEMTDDTHELDERILSAMKGSSTVDVKKKCRLGGLGSTSVACNQGDIKNLKIRSLKEDTIRHNEDVWAWVSPDNRLIRVPKLNHKGYIMNVYRNFSWDYDQVFDKAIEDGWVRVIYEYFPKQYKSSLSLNGYDKERVISVFKEMFYNLVKYGNNNVYLEYENPKGYDSFNMGTADGKEKMSSIIGEEYLNEDVVPNRRKFWAWVSPNNEFIEIPKMGHVEYIEDKYPNSDDVYADAIRDGWVSAMYSHYNDGEGSELSLNGIDKNRVKDVLKNVFGNLVKGGNLSIYMDYEDGTMSDIIHTQNMDGKMKLFDFLRENLDETIEASDAYSDGDALQSMIDGKKDVGFIHFKGHRNAEVGNNLKKLAIENGFKFIPVEQAHHNIDMNVVYRDTPRGERNAKRLYDIAMSHNGYLADKSPEEAWEIGKLLDYSEQSIKEYIKRRYVDKTDAYGRKYPEDMFPSDMVVDPKYYMNEAEIIINNIKVARLLM